MRSLPVTGSEEGTLKRVYVILILISSQRQGGKKKQKIPS